MLRSLSLRISRINNKMTLSISRVQRSMRFLRTLGSGTISYGGPQTNGSSQRGKELVSFGLWWVLLHLCQQSRSALSKLMCGCLYSAWLLCSSSLCKNIETEFLILPTGTIVALPNNVLKTLRPCLLRLCTSAGGFTVNLCIIVLRRMSARMATQNWWILFRFCYYCRHLRWSYSAWL